MVVGRGVRETQGKDVLYMLNYFLWWTYFVEKFVIAQSSRKICALMELEAVSYSQKLSTEHGSDQVQFIQANRYRQITMDGINQEIAT